MPRKANWFDEIDWTDPPENWLKFAPWPDPERYYGYGTPTVTNSDPFAKSHVYFMEFNGKTKIGVSNNVKQRHHQLSAGAPIGLRIKYTRKVPRGLVFQIERKIHGSLSDYSIGREWFAIDSKDALCSALPLIRAANKAHQRYVKDGFYGVNAILFGQ